MPAESLTRRSMSSGMPFHHHYLIKKRKIAGSVFRSSHGGSRRNFSQGCHIKVFKQATSRSIPQATLSSLTYGKRKHKNAGSVFGPPHGGSRRDFSQGCEKQKNLHLAGLVVVDAGGFEPPTARFVAEYSIQLSYASIWYFLFHIVVAVKWWTQEDSNLRPLGS